ncbi:glycosyltransferase family 20 [Ophiocordyceps camponoti-floridani]|uniref:Glycosyltransferase family 20 n=1 Tax=Ophiocordyceps camponoti-floridani TaxID=2030778 RepID=A0A8H4VD94_9HYPO|nr:glycosyltransferase family 20 [Ophiocordyceps camponoti-floridani]
MFDAASPHSINASRENKSFEQELNGNAGLYVPVTPEIRRDTYKEKRRPSGYGYFTSKHGVGEQSTGPALSGRVISATFTMPQTLRYNGSGKWEIERHAHRSSLLGSLEYLSSAECSWDHTVIAWTGELTPSPKFRPSSLAALPVTMPTSVTIEPEFDDTYVPRSDMDLLEKLLWNDRLRTVPIWLADESATSERGVMLGEQARWRAFADHDICALLHYNQYPPTAGREENERWRHYLRMNTAFADGICSLHKPGDIVMVYDYQLMLVPEMLRRRRPDIFVSFFLASPFPTSELMRCLHRREEMLRGILGADLIGLQASHYTQHLANSCERILGLTASSEGISTGRGWVSIGVFPEGIDVASITSLAFTESVDAKCVELRKLYGNRKLIVGCDPPDSLGGVDKKLKAFSRFLDMYPEWKGKVVLVQTNSKPAVEDVGTEESKYASRVHGLVHAVNQAYGSLGFMPVRLHSHHLSCDEYMALLRLGDANLVTCARQGMTATGLEYICCQRDGHGLLIISEFSGTACNLDEALHVNPWDAVGVAEQIHEALTMSSERRREKHGDVYRRLERGDVRAWVEGMVRCLVEAVGGREASEGRRPSCAGI